MKHNFYFNKKNNFLRNDTFNNLEISSNNAEPDETKKKL
jgi:hypothetical protein